MANPKLLMSFDPHTIEHLGIKMYSRLPNAMAELIANAYDADAKTVGFTFYGVGVGLIFSFYTSSATFYKSFVKKKFFFGCKFFCRT